MEEVWFPDYGPCMSHACRAGPARLGVQLLLQLASSPERTPLHPLVLVSHPGEALGRPPPQNILIVINYCCYFQGMRLNESVPPPHHHCFISERALDQRVFSISQGSFSHEQGLRCNQYMLAEFPAALRRAARFERSNFGNQEGRTIFKVLDILEDLQRALESLTGLVVNGTTRMLTRDEEACNAHVVTSEPSGQEAPEEEEEEETGRYDILNRNADIVTQVPSTTEPEVNAEPGPEVVVSMCAVTTSYYSQDAKVPT